MVRRGARGRAASTCTPASAASPRPSTRRSARVRSAIGICCEYDALPDIGHACGHNVIAAAGVGAGLALAPLADALGCTIHVLGTPAEEGGGGKILMLEAGAFDGLCAA